MTGKSALDKSVRCSSRPARSSLWAFGDAAANAVLVNTFAGLPIPLATVDHTTSTLTFFATDNSDHNARKPSASSPGSRGRRGDDSSSEPFARRNLALLSDLTRRNLWHMTRWSETRRLSWCIANLVHVNNDFQLDYSAWRTSEI